MGKINNLAKKETIPLKVFRYNLIIKTHIYKSINV